MSENKIISPNEMHLKASVSAQEVVVEELGFYKLVQRTLQGGHGLNQRPLTLHGITTKEYEQFYITDMKTFGDGLRIAQTLWDAGYYVCIINPIVPKDLKKIYNNTSLVVSWDPILMNNRGCPSPCWTCNLSYAEKAECSGCKANAEWSAELDNYKIPVSPKQSEDTGSEVEVAGCASEDRTDGLNPGCSEQEEEVETCDNTLLGDKDSDEVDTSEEDSYESGQEEIKEVEEQVEDDAPKVYMSVDAGDSCRNTPWSPEQLKMLEALRDSMSEEGAINAQGCYWKAE